MNDVAKFFETLAERNLKENYISDILWALIESNVEFLDILFELIGEKTNKTHNFNRSGFSHAKREVTEVTEVTGRPDLILYFNDESQLIIEVKKYKRDLQLDLYDKIFNNQPKVLLSYYKEDVSNYPNWTNITWSEITKKLDELMDNNLLNGFSHFIKGVFNMNCKKVESFSINNLVYLNMMIEESLKSLNYNIRYRDKGFTDAGSGYFFSYPINDNICLYPWIGINYNIQSKSKNPFGLMFWLNQGHKEQGFFNKIINNEGKIIEGGYADPINTSADQIVIMQDWSEGKEFRAQFLNKNSVEEQTALIQNFIKRICETIEEVCKE